MMINRDMLMVAVGAVLGSLATYIFVKDKYKKLADEEIASVKEARDRNKDIFDTDAEVSEQSYKPTPEDLEQLKTTIVTNGYSERMEEKERMEPYIISPEEYDEAGYNTTSLTYWNDDVLTDEYGNIFEDFEDSIPSDFADHFGEYEDDSVFVRNDEEQMDYEILKDTRDYYDVYPDD